MSEDKSAFVALVGALLTLLFAWVGFAMWHDAPNNADAAAGKVLATFAAGIAIVTVAYVLDHWDRSNSMAAGNRRRPTSTDVP